MSVNIKQIKFNPKVDLGFLHYLATDQDGQRKVAVLVPPDKTTVTIAVGWLKDEDWDWKAWELSALSLIHI